MSPMSGWRGRTSSTRSIRRCSPLIDAIAQLEDMPGCAQ
jgi:hypothetical protein